MQTRRHFRPVLVQNAFRAAAVPLNTVGGPSALRREAQTRYKLLAGVVPRHSQGNSLKTRSKAIWDKCMQLIAM
jgi:hypothetical protein